MHCLVALLQPSGERKMQNGFTEEFEKVTSGAFPMLKFRNATYTRDMGTLIVRFNISAYSARAFTDEQKKEVNEALKKIFNGIVVKAEYVRTFADETTVKNKVLEFFNLRNQMVFKRIRNDTIKVEADEENIFVTLRFDPPTCNLLETAGTERELAAFLDASFNPVPHVSICRTEEEEPTDNTPIDTVVRSNPSIRLISLKTGEKVYARGNVAGISQMPAYIADIKGSAENAVLCGKIAGLAIRSYKNKKYDPNDPKTGPEELPLVRFILNDTTGTIECVAFPKESAPFEALADGDEVVCTGKISPSTYNGALSFALNAVFTAKIDYSSIKAAPSKPVPARYTLVKPNPYNENLARTLFDDPAKAVSDYFKDKTFVVFDFEATGTDTATSEPIEIAAVKVVNGVANETFTTLLDPHCPIPEKVKEITHINNDMVAGKPSFKDVLPDFFKFTRGAVLVGHNISGYDFPLLMKYAAPEGYVFDNDIEDTLILARKYITESRHLGLEALSRTFGISHENAHRAMADVLATLEVLRIIADRM